MSQTSTAKVIGPAWDVVFTALKGWTQWTERIATFADSDEDRKRFLTLDANISRCPLITAAWDDTQPRWWVFSQQEWLCPLRVEIYVPHDRNRLAMNLIEDVIDAVFRFEAPGSTAAAPVPLVKKTLCRDPIIQQFQSGTFAEVGEGGNHKLLMSSVVFQLSLRKDPKIRGS